MGKPTGFMEYARSLPIARAPAERVRDWREFHAHLPDDALREQGARCMDCGVPFCHTGKTLGGTTTGCPVNNLIPEWNDLVYRNQWRLALDRLLKTNNFPEFTGRVCPAPCESSCVLGINEPPVTIKTIECAIVDKGFEEGWIAPEPPVIRTGKRVAVVGSGPAGLSCAAQLNKAGHRVTVFERDERIGGLLMYGIPNMKLDKSHVHRRVDLLKAEGVEFRTNAHVGCSVSVDELRREFDALVLCGGACAPRDLRIEGRELRGIYYAMDFLRASAKSLLDGERPEENPLSAKDKDVIVIGGGDTGTDCVATALRQGCRSLAQFEIMPQPPAERAPDNPWPQWAKVYRLDYGQEEAAAIYGHDPRAYSIMSERFLDDGEGNVRGVETSRVEWIRDESGRMTAREIPDTKREWSAQLVLLALGFVGAEKEGLLEKLGVAMDARGNVSVDEEKMTSVAGVFAAGDMARGQSLVVWAIADGRRAARGVDKYLMGSTSLP